MNDHLHSLVEEAKRQPATQQAARRALGLLDLTSLGDSDTEEIIAALCKRANGPAGHTAAVCVYDRFVPQCRKALEGTPVQVATVCNFPHGGTDSEAAANEATAQVKAGAHEVDVVLPYKAYIAGDRQTAKNLLAAVRKACGDKALLKVIIETGELRDSTVIREASRDAILAGADFIKTSTGKVAEGATLRSAALMLDVIREMQPELDRPVGFKPAGGIKNVADTAAYLFLADSLMGPDWASPRTFRFGASGVLNAILAELGFGGDARGQSGY